MHVVNGYGAGAARVALLVATLTGMALAGCAATESPLTSASFEPSTSQSDQPTESATAAALECPTTPIEVEINYELATAGSGIFVDVTSNLPDDSNLQVSISSPSTSYLAQDDSPLAAGSATFGPFSDGGAQLQGTYDLSITLPIARNQPEQVQECIGTAGEHLSGPLVEVHEITGDNVANLTETITLPVP